jgi:NitT/TauT family transport system substrate-binding protein
VTRRRFFKYIAASSALWSGCGLDLQPPIRIGANIWPGFECLFIARSLRLFGDKSVKLVEYPSSPETIRAFKNRAIEIAAMTADEFLRLSAEEPELRAFLVTDFSRGADALVGRAGHRYIRDLRGKKVGVELNALGVYMLTRALNQGGVAKEDIEIVPVENDQHFAAFTGGRVDAVVTFEPHRSKLLDHGGRVLFDSSQIPGEVVDYLVTRRSVLRERGPAIKAILKGWFEARERLLNEGEDVARLVASREGITPGDYLKSLDLLELPSAEANRQLLEGNGKSFALLRNTHKVMVQSGLFHGAAPGPELFEGGFLP